MRWFKKFLAALLSLFSGIGVLLGGGPPDVAGLVATSVAVLLQPMERPRSEVRADTANHVQRSEAYAEFGRTVAVVWQAAGLLLTFRPRLLGYVHGMLGLMRAQRRFEEQLAAVTAALSTVLLYGSTETQEAALGLFKVLGEKLTEAGRSGKQGSAEVRRVYEAASLDLGDRVVAWRRAAQRDLDVEESPC